MTSDEIRETFLAFFEGKGHERVPSASVVPADDPTLYFTNAGMNQFKDVFLGLGRRPYTRAVDTQKCIRVSGKHNDLEEVGISPWHHTFFEMLGNWSFGDYFKAEAIAWAWELVTGPFGLEPDRLWATVFEGGEGVPADEEAERLWVGATGLRPGRVVRLPGKDNFWEMGETGPCGPCSEVHYYLGDDLGRQSADLLRADGGDFVEIWNLVFIQFNRDAAGALEPLPAQHVDTGMGFERVCSLLQHKDSNYDTDVFRPQIERIAEMTGADADGAGRVPTRVIADHVRALTFAIADGALPANDGRGYVLRRILRRAARFGRQLDQHEPFIHRLVAPLADSVAHVFPEARQNAAHVAAVLRAEEEAFGKTLDRGLEIFERVSRKGEISGADAFQLYDTYGFPLDLTGLMARERGLAVDTEGFERELEGQRRRARAATKGRFRAAEGVGDAIAGAHSAFIGYDELEADARVVAAEVGGDGHLRLVLDRTPFYAESGGQVGDRGAIAGEGFRVEVEATVKARGGIVHVGRLTGERPGPGAAVHAGVDPEARQAAARNHTATHLLHEALRRTLGDHVAQMGSLVAPDRLRFDFSHFQGMEPVEVTAVEQRVNEQIRADLEVSAFEEDLARARQLGARALFGEKYGDRVRVVRIGGYSLELCGGTHVRHTGQIGLFDLSAEGGIAAGTRRVEALSGAGAEDAARRHRELVRQIGQLLNAPAEELPAQVRGLVERTRDLERALAEARRRAAGGSAADLTAGAAEVDGIRVVASRVEVEDVESLRSMADGIRDGLRSGVGVLGAQVAGKVSFIAVVTDDLIQGRGLRAGEVVKAVAQIAGGSGGGKPHMAQAGGRDPEKIDAAIAAVPDIVRRQLAGA